MKVKKYSVVVRKRGGGGKAKPSLLSLLVATRKGAWIYRGDAPADVLKPKPIAENTGTGA